jgi:hypothetical protein
LNFQIIERNSQEKCIGFEDPETDPEFRLREWLALSLISGATGGLLRKFF